MERTTEHRVVRPEIFVFTKQLPGLQVEIHPMCWNFTPGVNFVPSAKVVQLCHTVTLVVHQT